MFCFEVSDPFKPYNKYLAKIQKFLELKTDTCVPVLGT